MNRTLNTGQQREGEWWREMELGGGRVGGGGGWLRIRMIYSFRFKKDNLVRLSLLLASINENIVRNMSVYLHNAFKLRSVLMS